MNLQSRIHTGLSTILLFLISILTNQKLYPQELNITPYLIKIEAGKKAEVSEKIPELKQKYPNSSSLVYLEGLLTEEGEKAFQIFSSLLDNYPKSKYADDAIYRIYSYFIAVDKPDKAQFYLNRLRNEHPESPYIKVIEKTKSNNLKKSEVTVNKNESMRKVEKKLSESSFAYTIQAGAFSNKENALKLQSDFEDAGYSSQVKEKSVGGSLFHVVFVGKFVNENDAKRKLDEINSKFKVQGWVVKLN